MITARARELNFTNEGGVCGTTRLLKNIAGLWLLQACRRNWAEQGHHFGYDELLALGGETHGVRSLFDPDHPTFLHPRSMVSAMPATVATPVGPSPTAPLLCSRHPREPRVQIPRRDRINGAAHGHPVTEIRIVGGSRNRLLNQFTADATGRTVVAGPVEASALGNIAMQMVATKAVSSLDERGSSSNIRSRSGFEPVRSDGWDAHYRRFHGYLEPLCLKP